MDSLMEDPACRVCGCTDNDCRQCIERTGEPCSWVYDDVCSACYGEEFEVKVTCHFKDSAGMLKVLSFETDLVISSDYHEQIQLKHASATALLKQGWKNCKITGITYEILNDGETEQ